MRIGIVNDTPLAVEILRRSVASAPEHSVAWIARDGAEAVAAAVRDTPDVILMDLVMPVMDGAEATRQIMAQAPCAILVVTASVNGNCGKAFEAMGAGAVDLIQTPAAGKGTAALLYKIECIGKLIGKTETPVSRPPEEVTSEPGLIAIGASAGGPPALAHVLGKLPPDLSAGVVIVQHVDVQFVEGLVEWLGRSTALTVRIAREGDTIEAGVVLLPRGDEHLVFSGPRTLGYSRHPEEAIYRPSIDVFFHSAARRWRGAAAGALLTGMGRDGAAGLKAMREAGFHTIGQDRETSAVYGMPKAAAELGATSETLPLERIAPALAQRFPPHRTTA